MLMASWLAYGDNLLLYKADFGATPLGRIPAGWRDLGIPRSSPMWGVDGKGLLRTLWKAERGLIAYEGALANGETAAQFADGDITAEFQKTPDPTVSFGVAGRIRDAKNYYVVRFTGMTDLSLIKVADGKEDILAQFVTRSRYQEGQTWRLSLALNGARLTGRIIDGNGVEQARVDALEEEPLPAGAVGIECSNYSAAKSFSITAAKPFATKLSAADMARKNGQVDYPDTIVAPAKDVEKLNTPFQNVADTYDVIVAGAGTGGWAAALQASRLGAKVLLVEESDWIGGQMAAAAVTSMDESGIFSKFPVRERGIYREFHQSVINHYLTFNKDPYRAYYAWPEQIEGGYEPKIARAILYGFIAEARKKGTLDIVTGARLTQVLKRDQTVTGVVLEKNGAKKSPACKSPACKVLVEATEYGDVLPLAGARYRVGTVTSDKIAPDSPVQAHTWVAVIREYPEGLPEHLRIKSPPPGYDARRYKKSQLYGRLIWGSPGKDYKGPRVYRVLFAWRGMADIDSPTTGTATQQRHTQCGLNGGRQDYPVTAAGIEDPATRRKEQVEGIYRALNEIYYLQNELGLPWSVADDEGYDTGYQRENMALRDLRPDLLPLALHLPQWPYVRECRRGIGLYTLRTSDLGRFEQARLFANSVAMGDYFMDIDHGKTGEAIELDLDPGKPTRESGPFQVPFEVFIPEKIDGLVLAEKNISQSRIVNGATRLQPVTMLTGQAAGAIAAEAARQGIQPRQVNPIKVQAALLNAGANLIQRWYEDVPWGSRLWRATQLLSLHGVVDVPGPFVPDAEKGMGDGNFWRPAEPLDEKTFSIAIRRLAELAGKPVPAQTAPSALKWNVVGESLTAINSNWRAVFATKEVSPESPVTRGDFALAAAQVLAQVGKPTLLRDPTGASK